MDNQLNDEIGLTDSVTVVRRSYLSLHLLYAALQFAHSAQALEEAVPRLHPHDPRHRSYVLGSVMSATTFLDAVVNEVLQDASDNADEYCKQLPAGVRARLATLWEQSDRGKRFSTLERYAMALSMSDKESMPKGSAPTQEAQLVVQLRNWIVHYRPEDQPDGQVPKLGEQLRNRFESNRIMDPNNQWFPDRALSAGCARWAVDAIKAFTDEWCRRMDVKPVYRLLPDLDPPVG